jgi:enoyl-CoA hydratase/carnithine racemase
MAAAANVETSAGDGVLTIRFNRPDKRNALTSAMYATLADELTAADDSGVAAVVLTGAGQAFTSGNDLEDMKANPPVGENPPPVRFLEALTRLRAVLVAAVDGPAIGVGTTVLLHCDLVYATRRSTFRLPFVDLGLVPEAASTLLLPRLVGHQRAAELMLFGEKFDAERATRIGLVSELTDDADCLTDLVGARVAALAGKPRAALLATKSLLADGSAVTVRDRLDLDRRVLQGLLGLPETGGADH